jgi:hypothetical protein
LNAKYCSGLETGLWHANLFLQGITHFVKNNFFENQKDDKKTKKTIDKKVVDHFVKKTGWVGDVRGFSAWGVGESLLGGGINQLIFDVLTFELK